VDRTKTISRINNILDDIEGKKTASARLEGSITQLLEQLGSKFGCGSSTEGQKQLKRRRSVQEKSWTSLEQDVQKLEDEYPWEDD